MITKVWTPFSTMLPRSVDADHNGQIELLEQNGSQRRGLWNWITPTVDDAAARWRSNGFTAWRPGR